eukprot:XP_766693.1 hypothetical protein [Theileria parva strain Muguga]
MFQILIISEYIRIKMAVLKRIIPESQLPSLKDYTFKPGNFTFLDNLMLKYYWDPVVKILPKLYF